MAGPKPHVVDTSRSALGLPEDISEKKVEKIASGKQKKKTKTEMFAETFLGGDLKSVGEDIVTSIVIPAVKNTISDLIHSVGDIFTGGADRILYGDNDIYVNGSRNSHRHYVSYDRASKTHNRTASVAKRRDISAHARQEHDFSEIILNTRAEAEDVLANMADLISQYDAVSIADLYTMVDITPSYTDNDWGWTDIRGSSVRQTRDGFVLMLPEPDPIGD